MATIAIREHRGARLEVPPYALAEVTTLTAMALEWRVGPPPLPASLLQEPAQVEFAVHNPAPAGQPTVFFTLGTGWSDEVRWFEPPWKTSLGGPLGDFTAFTIFLESGWK